MTSPLTQLRERAIAEWPKNRRRNLLRYTLVFGAVGFGGLMFLTTLIQLYFDGRATSSLLLLLLVMCPLGGIIFGLCMCLFFELRYRIWRRGNAA